MVRKTARRRGIKTIHDVSAWAVESSLVFGQLCVDEKTNGSIIWNTLFIVSWEGMPQGSSRNVVSHFETALLFTARDAHLLRIPYENQGSQAASPSL